MVKPSQPKGIKPKVDITDSPVETGGSDIAIKKLIVANIAVTVLISILFIASTYAIVNGIVNRSIQEITASMHGETEMQGEDGEETHVARGIILDLGEFILNLSDPNSKRYLKVNVALELSRANTDPVIEGQGGGAVRAYACEDGRCGGGGNGGGHGAKEVDPMEAIQKEMEQYKPAIRDAVISVLSSKTAEELSSLSGKELAKEQIKAAVDPLFGGKREVMRVSFGTFIIQ